MQGFKVFASYFCGDTKAVEQKAEKTKRNETQLNWLKKMENIVSVNWTNIRPLYLTIVFVFVWASGEIGVLCGLWAGTKRWQWPLAKGLFWAGKNIFGQCITNVKCISLLFLLLPSAKTCNKTRHKTQHWAATATWELGVIYSYLLRIELMYLVHGLCSISGQAGRQSRVHSTTKQQASWAHKKPTTTKKEKKRLHRFWLICAHIIYVLLLCLDTWQLDHLAYWPLLSSHLCPILWFPLTAEALFMFSEFVAKTRETMHRYRSLNTLAGSDKFAIDSKWYRTVLWFDPN